MIGLPDETLDDVKEIASLCKRVIQEGRIFHGKRAGLHVSIGTFIPKPHTPFQWRTMDSIESISEKQSYLRHELRGPGLHFNWADVNETLFEAWMSRGDRHLSEVIFQAWKAGAKFDAWRDNFDIEIWKSAFASTHVDPFFYSHRERSYDEVLPWDHISMGVSKNFLIRQDLQSKTGLTQKDCSSKCNACGILSAFGHLRKSNPLTVWKCPEFELIDD